jgi:hypothetical protein
MAEGKATFWIDGIEFGQGALFNRPQHAAVLGRIFTSWSMIEGLMASLLGLLMHADDRAALAILETFHTNHSRIQAVRKVAKRMLASEQQAEFEALTKSVSAYAEQRNIIAHSLWGAYVGAHATDQSGWPDGPDSRLDEGSEESGIIYRMSTSVLSDFVVPELPKNFDADTLTSGLLGKMTRVSIGDLEKIEKQGFDVLSQVMGAVSEKKFARSVEVVRGTDRQ